MPNTMKVFTVKTAYTHAFFTIRSSNANGEKPMMVAFKNKKHAQSFIMMRNVLMDQNRRQPVKIEAIPITSLARRCALNALDLCVYDEKYNYVAYTPLEEPDDSFMFNLECVMMYNSN